MDIRSINTGYQDIANALICELPELSKIRDVRIICLSSTHSPKKGDKIVYGQCEKISEKYKWGIPCDFTITVFEPNVIGFSEEQIKILILHELLHVGVDGDKLFVRQHDLEDFKLVIDKYGTNWADVGGM